VSYRVSVQGERAIRWYQRAHGCLSLAHLAIAPSACSRYLPRNRRADGHGRWKCRLSVRSHHELLRVLPDASRPPADKAVVEGRVRPKALRRIAPRCAGARYLENAVENTSVVDPRHTSGLVRQKGLMAVHSKSVSSYLMIRDLWFGSLNHANPAFAT
jgi:hypothetical protein